MPSETAGAAMPTSPDDRDHADGRREADAQIVLQLAAQGFDPGGAAWRTLAPELLAYGYSVLKGWLIAGRAREKAARLGVRGTSRIPVGLKLAPDDAHELAIAVLEVALPRYLRTLGAGKWDPTKGSSLASYFIGGCLHDLPDVSASWGRERERRDAEVADPIALDDGRHSPDPAGQALASVQLDEILRADEQIGVMLHLWGCGYSYGDIAELFSGAGIEHTAGSVRCKIFRARKLAVRRRDDGARGGDDG